MIATGDQFGSQRRANGGCLPKGRSVDDFYSSDRTGALLFEE